MSDFQTLKADVADFIDKDNLSSKMGTFVNLGVHKMNRKLRIMDMEVISHEKLATSKNYFGLPDRFIAARNIYLNTNPEKKLTYLTPEQLTLEVAPSGELPTSYTIIDGKIKTNATVALDSGITTELYISYYRGYPKLVNNADTNWVIQNAYDLALYLSIIGAEFYIINDERLPLVKQLAEEAITELNDAADEGRYSGDTLRIRAT